MALDKSTFFTATKPKVEVVPIDGFGNVGIVQLTVKAVNELRDTLQKAGQTEKFSVNLVCISAVDPADGVRIFDESDVAALEEASNAAVEPLMRKAMEINGFAKAADAKN